MNCSRFELAVHEYYRGTLAPDEHRDVEAHARACPACARLKATCEETCCRDFVDELPRYLEGELPTELRQLFERHLGVCADCRAYLASYRAALSMTAAAFQEPEPEALPEDLIRSILDSRPRRPGDAQP